jgi:DNA-binding NarL/FixJ family response regulator
VSSPSILIVEDHDLLRESMRDLLAGRFPACRIVEAEDGQMAVSLATELRPLIVIMDINLPGTNGLDAARAIRQILPSSAVVIHSMEDSPAIRERAAAAGAVAYVSKGQGIRRLIEIIEEIMGPLPPSRTPSEP